MCSIQQTKVIVNNSAVKVARNKKRKKHLPKAFSKKGITSASKKIDKWSFPGGYNKREA